MIRIAGSIRRFRSQSSGRRKLPFPLAPNLRIAQVTADVASFDSVEVFPRERWDELVRYRPRVLVGAAADFQQLAELSRIGALDLSTVDHVIFVLTECGHKPATDVLRVLLWQAFGVPVYELLIGVAGSLLASECEAHEGWHVETGAKFSRNGDELVVDALGRNPLRTGLRGVIETEPCPCGRAGSRLIDVELLRAPAVRRELAATA